jgi:hypothetical protein
MQKPEPREDPSLLGGVRTLVGTSRLRRRADVKSRLVEGEIVILDREEELIHQLNKTASYIWEQCDGQHTASEIANHVSETFEVDESTALSDVLEMLKALQRLNLIENV